MFHQEFHCKSQKKILDPRRVCRALYLEQTWVISQDENWQRLGKINGDLQ